jgi:D-sedoheptulose 7-phosphate isomerase
MELTEYLGHHNKTIQSLLEDEERIRLVVDAIARCIARGGIIWTAGNGGSASTASHLVCDLAKGVALESKRQVRAFCLNDNLAINTAWANDFSYDVALQQQLELSAKPEDLFIAISGSGKSANINNALRAARRLKVESIALLGFSGGSAKDLADLAIVIKSDDMQVVENFHLILAHWIFKALQLP